MTHVPDFNDSIRLLKKIKEFTANDLRNSMFCAKANFLVALGILSYMEFLGGLRLGHYQKTNGSVKIDKNGNPLITQNSDRFNAWLEYMNGDYANLTKKRVYDKLRCGLVHEYLVKDNPFTIYNPDRILSDDEMRRVEHNGKPVSCGIEYNDGKWFISNPKLYIDFVDAFERYIAELESSRDANSVSNFMERVKEINLGNFS